MSTQCKNFPAGLRKMAGAWREPDAMPRDKWIYLNRKSVLGISGMEMGSEYR